MGSLTCAFCIWDLLFCNVFRVPVPTVQIKAYYFSMPFPDITTTQESLEEPTTRRAIEGQETQVPEIRGQQQKMATQKMANPKRQIKTW